MEISTEQHFTSPSNLDAFQITFQLHHQSLRQKQLFYSLLSEQEEFTIPNTCYFVITSIKKGAIRIQANLKDSLLPECLDDCSKLQELMYIKKRFSFYVQSSLKYASLACSQLNMANSLSCKITVKSQDKTILFTVTSPDIETNQLLMRSYDCFILGDVTNC